MQKLTNLIANTLKEPASNVYLDNVDPSTGQVYSHIPRSEAADLEQAISAAESAFESWSTTSQESRSQIMLRIAQGIEDRIEEFAMAESRDNGKPVSLATAVDIPRAVSNFRFFAKAITQFSSESHSMPGTAINYTLKKPIGVVGCISPWNLPLYLFTWKIAPALATGNCVIAKPSEVTPYTAHLLAEVCIAAGLPSGVLSILHGLGGEIGADMVAHPKVKAISFTGGTSTGKAIAKVAAPMFKKLSLELGGKNPNIIFADCDYDTMLSTTIRSSFANQGQICLCGSRILVEESIYEQFKTDFIAKVKAMKVGDPADINTKTGAVVSKPHMEKILGYIKLAEEEGGTIEAGGNQVILEGRCAAGYFVEPTVITGLNQYCRTNQEEIFGPVVTVESFKTEQEALEKANAVEYGLASTIWTSDLSRAHRMADKVEAGIVWINCWLLRDLRTPFGGMKSSGIGREGGLEALRFFTEPKNVCIKY